MLKMSSSSLQYSLNLFLKLPGYDICWISNFESYVAIASSESFADSSRAGIGERHLVCVKKLHASR